MAEIDKERVVGLLNQILEQELNGPIEETFAEFSTQPFAAASIGQVHRARLLREDRWVAVKIQRPYVAQLYIRDMSPPVHRLGWNDPTVRLLEENDEARERVREKLSQLGVSEKTPYLIFCGGGKAPTQKWSLMRYAHVLKTVADQFHLPVIGLGSAAECAGYNTDCPPKDSRVKCRAAPAVSEMRSFRLSRIL